MAWVEITKPGEWLSSHKLVEVEQPGSPGLPKFSPNDLSLGYVVYQAYRSSDRAIHGRAMRFALALLLLLQLACRNCTSCFLLVFFFFVFFPFAYFVCFAVAYPLLCIFLCFLWLLRLLLVFLGVKALPLHLSPCPAIGVALLGGIRQAHKRL